LRRGAEATAASGPCSRDTVRARNDCTLAIMPRISFQREADDRVSDIARADRPDCNRDMGGTAVSADIIQFIPRPGKDHEQTDFPTIAFRSVVRDLVKDHVDTAPCEYVDPEVGET